ncbi:hypothetical protein G4Y79_11085 [Phototrophicus methaneseepsis]|uniref:Uncharacterized protein n=1 Tax=Phototrophicus methaneseepsis TaxID=2710758 RepID=A0A7S8IGP6_9CHLR|nr:hypothetical protein [Phototrophicus methaneseepsis]QPC84884.1 hypothetical protein G4Y79_11085 [Phototrophicus methaneseepsis]
MLLWRIWRSMTHPPRQDPVFQRVFSAPRLQEPRITGLFIPWMMMFAGGGLCWALTFDWLPTLLIVALLSANTIFGLWGGTAVSQVIVAEKESSRYSLLATLPGGTLMTSWAMGLALLHRRPAFVWMPFLVRLGAFIIGLTLALMACMTFFLVTYGPGPESSIVANYRVIQQTIAACGLVAIFFFDHFYSIVTAVLVGIIAPVDVINRYEAQSRTIMLFLGTQITVYVVTLLVFIAAAPLASTISDGIMGAGFRVLLTVGVYLLQREALIRWLWSVMCQRLNAGTPEVDDLLAITIG